MTDVSGGSNRQVRKLITRMRAIRPFLFRVSDLTDYSENQQEDLMSVSRRAFFRTVGAGAGALTASVVTARTRDAVAGTGLGDGGILDLSGTDRSTPLKISGNENARGPGDAALKALSERVNYRVGRYPNNRAELTATLAKKFDAKPENILMCTGSTYALQASALAFLSPTRPLVAGNPSFEVPVSQPVPIWFVEKRHIPVRTVPLDSAMKLDLEGMAAVSNGAGMVMLCNPNNPTATAVSSDAVANMVARVRQRSPDTVVVIDEAYIDYATDPSVSTAAPLALKYPNVIVTRTGSKAYGMAGLRFGYAIGQPKTLSVLSETWGLGDVNVLTAAAMLGSLNAPTHMEQERAENRRVREFTIKAFKEMGYSGTDSQANFVFINIQRPAQEFKDACAKENILVGRDFRPLEKTHARISLGTMEEMQRAVGVFRQVLSVRSTTAGHI